MNELRQYSRLLQVLMVVRQIVSLAVLAGVIGWLLTFPETEVTIPGAMLGLCWTSGGAMTLYLWLRKRREDKFALQRSFADARRRRPKGLIGVFVDAWRVKPASAVALLLLSGIMVGGSILMPLFIIRGIGELLS